MPDPAPSGLVFNRRRWPSIHPAPTGGGSKLDHRTPHPVLQPPGTAGDHFQRALSQRTEIRELDLHGQIRRAGTEARGEGPPAESQQGKDRRRRTGARWLGLRSSRGQPQWRRNRSSPHQDHCHDRRTTSTCTNEALRGHLHLTRRSDGITALLGAAEQARPHRGQRRPCSETPMFRRLRARLAPDPRASSGRKPAAYSL
jgi:hypothetical protein